MLLIISPDKNTRFYTNKLFTVKSQSLQVNKYLWKFRRLSFPSAMKNTCGLQTLAINFYYRDVN